MSKLSNRPKLTDPNRLNPQTGKTHGIAISFFKTLCRAIYFTPEGQRGSRVEVVKEALEIMPWFPEEHKRLRGSLPTDSQYLNWVSTTVGFKYASTPELAMKLLRESKSQDAEGEDPRLSLQKKIELLVARQLIARDQSLDSLDHLRQLLLDNGFRPTGRYVEGTGFEFVYVISMGDRTKVGFTTDIEDRLASYKTHTPNKLEVFAIRLFPGDGRPLEQQVHKMLASTPLRVDARNEWYFMPAAVAEAIVIGTAAQMGLSVAGAENRQTV